ncbi:GTP cyclohydrolase II [Paeniglutamicibacter antarcticus]
MSLESLTPDGSMKVTCMVHTKLPTRHGEFKLLGYRDVAGVEHMVLTRGEIAAIDGPAPLVRLHSECLTGDALGSYRCDCGEQLDAALHAIDEAGRGILIYVRGHEGRGIGLMNKLRAYALQDTGEDTVDANTRLGLPVDARDYHQSAQILRDLGIEQVRLLSSNPAKQAALEAQGIAVEARIRLNVADRLENSGYLATKRARMSHDAPPERNTWDTLADGCLPDGALSPGDEALVERYAPLLEAGPQLVIAQLGQSMDGFIASRTGDACFVTGELDREHLHRLRALVDAVIVGAGTVQADDCQLTVRAVSGANPVRVVIDPHARIPHTTTVLTDETTPTLWLVGAEANTPEALSPHVAVHRFKHEEDFEPAAILGFLAKKGLRRVLVEGGGLTVSRFLHAGVLDRLYLTTAPLLVGDGVPGIRFEGTDALSGALSAPVRRFVFGEDICTEFNFTATLPLAAQGPNQQDQSAGKH